jgi:hypothetical protein
MQDGRGATPVAALNESQPVEILILQKLTVPDTNPGQRGYVTQVATGRNSS